MVKPASGRCDRQVGCRADCSHAYQQALDDFAIAQLLSHISNYSDANFNAEWAHLQEQELEATGNSSPSRKTLTKLFSVWLYQIRLNARIIETFGGTSLQDFGKVDSAVN